MDPYRVYIGGCSNGGYMTMNMVLRNPGFFAAAYPTCEAYMDQYISDVQIQQLAHELQARRQPVHTCIARVQALRRALC